MYVWTVENAALIHLEFIIVPNKNFTNAVSKESPLRGNTKKSPQS